MADNDARVCRVGINTLNRVTVPIIFVPGVMGSRLSFPTIGARWNPDSVIGDMLHWVGISADTARVQFDYRTPASVMTDSAAEPLLEDEVNRGWEGVCWGFYGEFLRSLNQAAFAPAQCPVYAVGYDWRQSNRDSGNWLAGHIEQILKTEATRHCIVITHSMGGIVTRAALKEHSDTAGKVIGVIHVVQPVTGAATAYDRFIDGASYNPSHFWHPLEKIKTFVFNKILGDTPRKYAKIQSGLRGPVELLPTKDYRDENDGAWLTYQSGNDAAGGNVYDAYRSAQSPPGLVKHLPASGAADHEAKDRLVQDQIMLRVDEAEAFHDWLKLFMHDETWAIYSTGLETDMAVVINSEDDSIEVARRLQGDTSVPETSGQALFPGQSNGPSCFGYEETSRQFKVQEVEHSEAFKSAEVQTLLKNIIDLALG